MFNRDVIEQVNKQFRLLITQIEDGEAEIERLRALVKEAYCEGFRDEWTFFDEDFDVEVENGWGLSQARAALQPKEGK
jgi:hypothetical protein